MPPAEPGWSVLDGAPDATLVVDESGVVVYANSQTAEMLGWRPEDLVGTPVDVLLPDELRSRHAEHMRGFHAAPRSRMMGVGLELVALRRDGTRVAVEIALSPIEASGGTMVLASVRDISERQRLTAELNETATRLALVDERDRIARDLHDRVIQRLFAAGLHLQAALGRPDRDEQVASVIDEIDEAIKEIRTTIFTMHSPRGLSAGCEPAVRTALNEASRVLGHQPRLTLRGPCGLISAALVVELVDVIRELLSNVAKHAKAESSSVSIEVSDGHLTLMVFDDGIGIDPATVEVNSGHGSQGLRNLSERARLRGGTATFMPLESGGTLVTWTVPLD